MLSLYLERVRHELEDEGILSSTASEQGQSDIICDTNISAFKNQYETDLQFRQIIEKRDESLARILGTQSSLLSKTMRVRNISYSSSVSEVFNSTSSKIR